ncbi:MAG: AAA family ATPase [Candidatus Aenigmarchaeota archaeon]|nr:AAA family ATPase [Candidatus Aenigmarchaeota archaeon]
MGIVVAVVGMPGSGKSEVVRVFEEQGFYRVYFGEPVFDRLKKEGLEVNEKNERLIREKMREEGGMGIMAKLSIPKIEEFLERGNVVVESMYSWGEYKILRKKYRDRFRVVAVYASPKTRYSRLSIRNVRPLSFTESENRDYSQIENLHTGGPIAMADFIIINEGTLGELKKSTEELIRNSITNLS